VAEGHSAAGRDHKRRRPYPVARRGQNRDKGRGAPGKSNNARFFRFRLRERCNAEALHPCHTFAPSSASAGLSDVQARHFSLQTPGLQGENRHETRHSTLRSSDRLVQARSTSEEMVRGRNCLAPAPASQTFLACRCDSPVDASISGHRTPVSGQANRPPGQYERALSAAIRQEFPRRAAAPDDPA